VVDKLEQKNNKMSPYYIRQIVAEFYLLKGSNMFSPGLVVYAIIQINKKRLNDINKKMLGALVLLINGKAYLIINEPHKAHLMS
jgi:hypothetical protein